MGVKQEYISGELFAFRTRQNQRFLLSKQFRMNRSKIKEILLVEARG
jgi:hypothetical protein